MPFNTTHGAPDTMMANQAHDLTPLLCSISAVPDYHHTCWVSCYCYLPTVLAEGGIQILDSAGPKLQVFCQTVLLNASTTDTQGSQPSRIVSVVAIQRTPTAGAECGGYAKRVSQSIPAWYTPDPSADYEKCVFMLFSCCVCSLIQPLYSVLQLLCLK